ncbi:uncharacterized protein KIAA1143 homolog [Dermatophagoides farinae]|uniref:DUF4604 domain-containing protein n=1 Tax=Dermatophagoides farinae TaxID=6954 RepID=A0A922I610_DERFA|nr:uncharacterized protein KIAA1143 homolog [Dermatophagoides farinae]KAH9522766.1 hypothetical protein DERF_006326 [Dermatophagoides farinae]
MAQRKRNIEFSRPEEPSFLKKMKNQMGIQKDFVTIDTKKEKLNKQDLEYRDEEPVYVVDESSGISEKELEMFKAKTKQEKDYQKDNESFEQRIIFKKPDKSNTNDDDQSGSSSTTTFQTTKKTKNFSRSNLVDKDRIKKVKNSSLLSFDDDDDDDGED